MALAELREYYGQRAVACMAQYLPGADVQPARLHQAMRYAVLNGGKRLRPLLVYLTGATVGAQEAALDAPACAVEFIHAYSLVHDDLPAMDDDGLRRGQPTCHVAFDEATAILAGDALQTLAFHTLATAGELHAEQRLAMVQTLAHASGSRGMAGGQAIDMAAVGQELTLAQLENMHIHKTGALIAAAVHMGVLASPQVDATIVERLAHYARCIGLAFQIHDDILDEISDTASLGKAQGADRARNKPTYPALLGLAGARDMAQELTADAVASLDGLGGQAESLRELAAYITQRRH